MLFQIGISQPETELAEETDSEPAERATAGQSSEKDRVTTPVLYASVPVTLFNPHPLPDPLSMVPATGTDHTIGSTPSQTGPARSAQRSQENAPEDLASAMRQQPGYVGLPQLFAEPVPAVSPGETTDAKVQATLRPESAKPIQHDLPVSPEAPALKRTPQRDRYSPVPDDATHTSAVRPVHDRNEAVGLRTAATVPAKDVPAGTEAVSFTLTPVETAKPSSDVQPDTPDLDTAPASPLSRGTGLPVLPGASAQSGGGFGERNEPERGAQKHSRESGHAETPPYLDHAGVQTNYVPVAMAEPARAPIQEQARTAEASAPPEVHVIDDSAPPLPPPPRISALSLQLEDPSGTRVDLHVRSTPERIEMAVATPDTALSDNLKHKLPELAAAVERQGYELTPGSSRSGSAWPDGEAPGQRSQHRQQPNRPRPRKPVATPEFTLTGVRA